MRWPWEAVKHMSSGSARPGRKELRSRGALAAGCSARAARPGIPAASQGPPAALSCAHQPAARAQVLSLCIPHALDVVKILDAFGTLCRTWFILDSGFPKFILSI